MPRSSDPRPRHQQIAAELRAAILAGDLPPGAKLDSTAGMMKRYATVNQTVQNALAMLKAEGYVEGQAGRGVFVRLVSPQTVVAASYLAPADAGQPYPWITEVQQRGHSGSTELLDVTEVRPPIQVAQAFGIYDPANEPVVMRSQVLLVDREPVELVKSYYPVDIARGTALSERRRIKGGTPRMLAELGLPAREAVDTVSARPPTSEEFIHLDLPQEVPVLRTFRVVYTDDQRPIEATVMVKAGHLYSLQYRLHS